jgi:hypothetical protein
MAAYRVIDYIIYLTDPVRVAELQAIHHAVDPDFPNSGPRGLAMTPGEASRQFNAPLGGQTPGGAWTPPGTLYAYSVVSLTPYTETMFFVLASPADQNTCTWRGFFLYQAPGVGVGGSIPPTTVYLGERLWVDGFELPLLGELGTGGTQTRISKAASRVVGGHGFAYRSNINGQDRQHNEGTGLSVHCERFYIQPLTVPVAQALIWSAGGNVSNSTGPNLQVNTDLTISAYNKGTSGAAAITPGALMGTTTPLTLGRWARIDVRMRFLSGAGQFWVYLNGVLQFTADVITGGGLAANQQWSRSSLGMESNSFGTATTFDCNYDDWIGTKAPVVSSVVYHGLDLTSGSHVQLHRPTGLAADDESASYTGNWRTLTGIPRELSQATSVNATTVALAIRSLTTDYVDQQMGCPAFCVGVYKTTAPVANGQLGWAIGTSGRDLALPTADGQWIGRVRSIADGTPLPLPKLSTLAIVHEKNNNATNVALQAAGIAAEHMGSWGPEDTPGVAAAPGRDIGHHNSPYPDLYVQTSFTNPTGFPAISSGTYTGGGNNAGQDVRPGAPPHWLWIRRSSGATLQGMLWHSGMETGHLAATNTVEGDLLPHIFIDPADGLATFRVAGADTHLNESGSTYQWVAVSDSALRFLFNNCVAAGENIPQTVPLWRTQFQADYGFFVREDWSSATSNRTYLKGPAHAGADASPVGATTAADVVSFGVGVISPGVTLSYPEPQMAFSLWRKVAGDGSPGPCSTTGLFDVVTYVGDGTSSRAIPVALGARSPLLAIGTPANGASFLRDPGHTSTNSLNLGTGGNSTTAFIGGDLDSVTVGLALNANGVTYTIFVLPGVATPGAWSGNLPGPYYPVDPDVCYPDCWGLVCEGGGTPGAGCSENLEPAPKGEGSGCSEEL